MSRELPVVALVGRTNVGKSTLFNRLVERGHALTRDEDGITRDRIEATAILGTRTVCLVDTAGNADSPTRELAAAVRRQVDAALAKTTLAVLVCDGRAGLCPGDEEWALRLRRKGIPSLVVVNKCDERRRGEELASEFFALGLGEPLAISAEHSLGLDEFIDAAEPHLPQTPDEPEKESTETRVLILGRPNVGKSTLANALLGSERHVVSNLAGTTRDAIESRLDDGVVLVDTPGVRKRPKVTTTLERDSVSASIDGLERAHVVILVVDAREPAVEQDIRLAALAERQGCALIICVNKADLLTTEAARSAVKKQLKGSEISRSQAPVIFISALRKEGLAGLLPAVRRQRVQLGFRAMTPVLNKLLRDLLEQRSPPALSQGRLLRLYYLAQVGVNPPSFMVVCNAPKEVPESYARFILNGIRRAFRLHVPLRLHWRARPGQKRRAERVRQYRERARHR